MVYQGALEATPGGTVKAKGAEPSDRPPPSNGLSWQKTRTSAFRCIAHQLQLQQLVHQQLPLQLMQQVLLRQLSGNCRAFLPQQHRAATGELEGNTTLARLFLVPNIYTAATLTAAAAAPTGGAVRSSYNKSCLGIQDAPQLLRGP